MNIRSISKKLIICLMIFLLLFNFVIYSVDNRNIVLATTNEEIAQEAEEEADSLLGGFLNGLAGVLTIIPKLLINICSMLLERLSYFIIDVAGHGDNEVSTFLTPFDIFFNKFTLTNVNIFQTEDIENTSGENYAFELREVAAMGFYIVRAISVGIILIMLLITGIKMAIASLAEKKAELKSMLSAWVVSAVLIFIIDMIIYCVIIVNENLVEIFENISNSASASGTGNINEMVASLRSAAFSENTLLSWGATIAYLVLTLQTALIVLSYIFRFFIVLVLIVFVPFIILTFSIDKANTGQAQTLNKWYRELLYNVFRQVLHCIIYVVVISVPMATISTVSIENIESLVQVILLSISLVFIRKIEEEIKLKLGLENSKSVSNYQSRYIRYKWYLYNNK